MTSRFKGTHPRPQMNAGRLFPHSHDRALARLPAGQRFKVIWPAPLGPWARGDVLERHVDLIGAHVPTLLRLGAIVPTEEPAYKAPKTIANLQARAALAAWRGETLGAIREAGAVVTEAQAGAMITAEIPGAPFTKKIVG